LQDVPENERIPISALEHYAYCPRQCALIVMEGVFDENIFTLQGRMIHERVDVPEGHIEGGLRIERGLPLWSNRLGLVGKADVVEFLPDGTPYPVDYKRGPRRRRYAQDLQLTAQALCLEEMLRRAVPCGAIFHHASRRRREVRFTVELRAAVEETMEAILKMQREAKLPPPVADARCRNCSLKDACLPDFRAVAEESHLRTLFAPS